jgi:hypothetical protein
MPGLDNSTDNRPSKKIAASRSRTSMNRLPRSFTPGDWPDNHRAAAKSTIVPPRPHPKQQKLPSG